MYIRKETGDDYAETVIGNRPSCMFAAGTRTEVLSCHQYLSAVGRIVQDKRLYFVSLLVVAPVAEQVFAESFFVGCFQETGWDDLVRIHIFERKRNTGRCYDIEFLFHLLCFMIYDFKKTSSDP